MLHYSICSGRLLSGGPVNVQLVVVLASGVRGGQRRTFGVDASALHLLRDHRLHRPLHLRSGHQWSRLVEVVIIKKVVVKRGQHVVIVKVRNVVQAFEYVVCAKTVTVKTVIYVICAKTVTIKQVKYVEVVDVVAIGALNLIL